MRQRVLHRTRFSTTERNPVIQNGQQWPAIPSICMYIGYLCKNREGPYKFTLGLLTRSTDLAYFFVLTVGREGEEEVSEHQFHSQPIYL